MRGKGDLEAFFKMLILRWHPDKFQQKFGLKLKEEERPDIIKKVNEA